MPKSAEKMRSQIVCHLKNKEKPFLGEEENCHRKSWFIYIRW